MYRILCQKYGLKWSASSRLYLYLDFNLKVSEKCTLELIIFVNSRDEMFLAIHFMSKTRWTATVLLIHTTRIKLVIKSNSNTSVIARPIHGIIKKDIE